MKKTAIQRIVFLMLAAALLWGVWAWHATPLDAGEVVLEDLDAVSGRENWQEFFRAARTGRPAAVHLTRRYSPDQWNPNGVVYEQDLVFDGEVYTISGETGGVDNGPYEEVYQYLLYFPDEPSPSPWARYETVTEYILTDDDTLTHQEIWRRLLSSSSLDRIRCRTVYSAYVWREGMAP